RARGDRAFPETEGRGIARPPQQAMCDEKSVVRRARRVGPVVQLRHDPLDLDASRAERQSEVIVAVWARADDQPLERRRSPVAIERPEEQFAEPPPGVDV